MGKSTLNFIFRGEKIWHMSGRIYTPAAFTALTASMSLRALTSLTSWFQCWSTSYPVLGPSRTGVHGTAALQTSDTSSSSLIEEAEEAEVKGRDDEGERREAEWVLRSSGLDSRRERSGKSWCLSCNHGDYCSLDLDP